MTTIVKNTGIDANRSRGKSANVYSLNNLSSHLNGDKNQVMSLDIEDKTSNLTTITERKEIMLSILQAINELPEELKVVMLPFYESQSYTEISESAQLPLTTVRARVHRAKQMLRKSFEGYDFANF